MKNRFISKKSKKLLYYGACSALATILLIATVIMWVSNNEKAAELKAVREETARLESELLDKNMAYYCEILEGDILSIRDANGNAVGYNEVGRAVAGSYECYAWLNDMIITKEKMVYKLPNFTIKLTERYKTQALKQFPKSILQEFCHFNTQKSAEHRKDIAELLSWSYPDRAKCRVNVTEIGVDVYLSYSGMKEGDIVSLDFKSLAVAKMFGFEWPEIEIVIGAQVRR